MADDWDALELLDDALAQLLAAPPPDAPLPLPPKKRRRRPKDELDYLNARVRQLSAELAAARASARASCRRREGLGDGAAGEWEQLAAGQRRQAERAAATNALLRATLEKQVALAKQLHATLLRHAKMARVSALPTIHDSQQLAAVPDLFTSLTQRLQELHARLDQVIDAAEFAPGQDNMRASTLTTDGGCAYFALSDARRLPFSVDAVHQAQWRGIALDGSKNLQGNARLVEKDLYYFSFTHPTPTSGGENANVKGQVAIRRFVDKARVSMVWAGVVEIDGSMYVRVREDGWGVTSAVDGNEYKSTLMRNLAHITPEVTDVATIDYQRAHVGEMTDLVLAVYRWQVAAVTQSVENMLFYK